MSTKDCVLCGKPVEECHFEEIKLTICCKECCENVSDPDERKLCSDARAKIEFGCRKRDLKRLDCLDMVDLRSRRLSRFQLYLLAEVKHLGEIARALEEKKANVKRPNEEEKCVIKRQRLETRHRVVVHDIRPILRPFVLGDYLQSSRSKTLLRDVRKRYSVKGRASELVESCKAHPLSALAFCIGHPSGTAQTYLELRENMKKALFIVGNKIMQMLTPGDRERLKGTPLEDVLTQFQTRDTKAILFRKLEEKVGTATAEEIISYSACQQRINRGGEESQIAEKLVAFWKSKDNTDQRFWELQNILDARRVRMGVIPGICTKYVDGEIDVDLDEVVGITQVNSVLFCMHDEYYSNYIDICEKEFLRCLIDEEMSLDESLDMAFEKVPKRRERHFFLPNILLSAAFNEDK